MDYFRTLNQAMKTVVMVPTYNEAENIGPLIREILAQSPNMEVVVVDDNSPDNTGRVVREMADRDPRVHLLLRRGPRGRGLAGREGFLWALGEGADYILEMDGDGSHKPEEIPLFLKAIAQADVVIGSRFLPGGKAVGRGWLRDVISALARAYLRVIIGTPVTDPTSGYRLFRKSALSALRPETLAATDPFIVTEVLYRCHKLKLQIKEVPIVFRDRERGKSKLKSSILIKYFFRVWKLKFSQKAFKKDDPPGC